MASTIKQALKAMVRGIPPRWTDDLRALRWLSREAHLLRAQFRPLQDLDAIVDALLKNAVFRPEQKRGEILDLLKLLRAAPPRRLCEIGGRRGGTLVLFAHVAAPDAKLLSLDIAYTWPLMKVAPSFATQQQRITCLRCDSHSAETLDRVSRWLGGELLDVLFIDGDHCLAGVTRDLEMYGPFVRPGGIVAVHDIVPDSKTRYGIPTVADTGDVPVFWRQVKERSFRVTEFIEHAEQDGFGIGVIHWGG